ncbi:AIG2-like family-domain-containing protein [Echria macrotheca]|uniref:Putative gamma-glutamylcyclotransferase n=1 Tax=Echria macrotheca TaxID=438768 RepID=A0AAJ0BLX7_9PEZI|nr:AIG2-like family-domain-containing protein [Echria macrotheca]
MQASESTQSDDGSLTAFFYGTLMVPGVFFSVILGDGNPGPEVRKLYSFTPAILHGYCRRRVAGADYPGITEDPAHSVFGTFVTGITGANMWRLDCFEGGQYERRTVRVRLLDKVGNAQGEGNVEGEERKADVYVFLAEGDLEDKEWDLEEFRRDKLRYWTRGGYTFEDEADSDDPATVATS